MALAVDACGWARVLYLAMYPVCTEYPHGPRMDRWLAGSLAYPGDTYPGDTYPGDTALLASWLAGCLGGLGCSDRPGI